MPKKQSSSFLPPLSQRLVACFGKRSEPAIQAMARPQRDFETENPVVAYCAAVAASVTAVVFPDWPRETIVALLAGDSSQPTYTVHSAHGRVWPESTLSAIHNHLDALLPRATQAVEGQASRPNHNRLNFRPSDVFKELHHDLFSRRQRHSRGEYYTPDWLVRHLLDAAEYDGNAGRLIDPACGSGTFLCESLGRLVAARSNLFLSNEKLISDVLDSITGIDLNPLAAWLARANLLLALRPLMSAPPARLPIACVDAILAPPPDEVFSRPFEFIVGNPPWIAWDHLPPAYREATIPLWRHYGLFSLSGNAARHGGAKKDLSMLMLYRATDCFAAKGARVAMVLPQTAFQSVGAGDGFRRFVLPDGTPLGVLRVDDFREIRVFAAASSTCTVVLEKGNETRFPVPYYRWKNDRSGPSDNRRNNLRITLFKERCSARPISDRPGAPWVVQPTRMAFSVHRLLGPSDYQAHLGANSGGANSVFWMRLCQVDGNKAWLERLAVGRQGRRLQERCLSTTSSDETARWPLESDLLYPLIRWGDIERFQLRKNKASASAKRLTNDDELVILLTQDTERRTGITWKVMAECWPLTLRYLECHRQLLESRAAYRRYQSNGPYWSMYNVGPYTLSPIKVIWRRMDRMIRAVAVGPTSNSPLGPKPWVPQETCVFVSCCSMAEAYYLAALLNSEIVGLLAAAQAHPGGKSFGTPGMFAQLNIRRFRPEEPIHRRLADLGCLAHREHSCPEELIAEINQVARAAYR